MTVLDVIHEIQAEAEVDHDFMDRMWAWLPDTSNERTVECAICGASVPASWADDDLCKVCAAQ